MATATRKTAARKTAASKTTTTEPEVVETPEAPKVKATSLRDKDRDLFKTTVSELKKSVGPELAHTFAHLAWTTTDTDPLKVMGKMSGNPRRNDAVKWLEAQGVVREPIAAQVAALVEALREEGADDAIVSRLVEHYGVGDSLI